MIYLRLAARLAFGVALAVSAAIAQQPAAPAVRLNVIPVDASGRFVPGLNAADLQIQDDGKPQKIASFRMVESAAGAPTIILFDLFNANLTERGAGEEQIVKAIEHLAPAANVYLYLLTPQAKLYAIHGIPEGVGREQPDARWPAQIRPMLDEAFRNVYALKPLTDLLPIYRAKPTWEVLETLATAMTGIPGRKNFVWITQGIPTGYIWPPNQLIVNPAPLRALIDRFNRLDVVAYTVQQRRDESIPQQGEASEWDTLRQLTTLTGGRAFPTDATVEAINQANADARAYYEVTYVRPAGNWNGKYHKIRVTSPRKDLRIQTKAGYYATAESSDPTGGE